MWKNFERGNLVTQGLITTYVQCVYQERHGTHPQDSIDLATLVSTWGWDCVYRCDGAVPCVCDITRFGGNSPVFDITCNKESHGVKSIDIGGHTIRCWSYSDRRPVHRLGKTLFKKSSIGKLKLMSSRNRGNGKHCDDSSKTELI